MDEERSGALRFLGEDAGRDGIDLPGEVGLDSARSTAV
jgi:hypothetical protein